MRTNREKHVIIEIDLDGMKNVGFAVHGFSTYSTVALASFTAALNPFTIILTSSHKWL